MSQATLTPGHYRNSNLFSGYYLDERVYALDAWDCDEAAREAYEKLQALYETEQDALESYDESPLREHWIDEVLSILGYETLSETPILDARGSIDRTLYETGDEQRNAAVMKSDGEHAGMYDQSLSVLEAKQWNADFTDRFSDRRSYRDASHQIKFYLEHTPESVSWGILTNGRKWRLYGTKDYETETYYEVDLPELLDSGSVEVFKYFYVFFRPAAFRESGGTTFLDTVWSESETAAQELGEDLQDNVFTALRVLGEGFVETNDLTIGPADDDRLGELKEQSLVLLYRLIFVLYAESRGLIDPKDTEEYHRDFSLGQLRLDILDAVGESADERRFEREYSEYRTRLWGQLENLFSLIDTGNESLGIPAYNGGLFDADRHEFLAEHEVADRYLAEVVYRLSTTETDEGFVPADYADLDTRHLGTIYEGLLEHEFAVAPEPQAAVAENGGEVWKSAEAVSVAEAIETVEKGELYVVNDDGERKATGAYYTPDYVVTYIVEETVGPLLSDIEAELTELEPGTEEYVIAFWERVTDLKILDPAMGSGHFLTKATGYLADAVMEQVRELETGRLFDEEQVRREISRECIYGVDINGMAVELAKLSMWLETLAADSPLAFLDHHVKTGNSLVGSDITEVLSNGEPDEVVGDEENGTVQPTLGHFNQVRRRVLEHVMDRVSELLAIDNETLADIHSMEDIYDDIRDDPLYGRLFAMATVHTASQFGLDIPGDAIERMAEAIEDEDEWAEIEATDWFRAARAMSGDEGFFHWELEFPEVFFGADGERMESAGFDAVVGNPPWLNAWEMTEKMPGFRESLTRLHEEDAMLKGHWDFYIPFVSRSLQLCRDNGKHSFVLPNTALAEKYATAMRKSFVDEHSIESILDFGEEQVFPEIERQCIIYIVSKGDDSTANHSLRRGSTNPFDFSEIVRENTSIWSQTYNYQMRIGERFVNHSLPILQKLDEFSDKLGQYHYVNVGATVSSQNSGEFTKSDVISDEPEGNAKPFFQGSNLQRWAIHWNGEWLDYRRDEMSGPRTPEMFESEKIVVRKRTDKNGVLAAAYDDEERYCDDTVIVCCQYAALEGTSATTDFEGFDREDDEIDLQFTVSLVNSSLMTWVFKNKFETGALQGSYSDVWPQSVRSFPIPTSESRTAEVPVDLFNESGEFDLDSSDTAHDVVANLSDEAKTLRENRNHLNLDLPDYLGTYTDGPTLGECNYQPPSGLSSSVLTETAASSAFENLRVTAARVEREGGVVRVLLVPYVKPAAGEEYETNSRGYATLEPVPAMEFFDLSEAQAALIEAFVPYAVSEAGGFAGYRDNATKNISPLDRLEGLTLPTLSDVEGGIGRYAEARERAAELDAKIEKTDALIDEIVYELYGLTDEEIEIVEDAVGE